MDAPVEQFERYNGGWGVIVATVWIPIRSGLFADLSRRRRRRRRRGHWRHWGSARAFVHFCLLATGGTRAPLPPYALLSLARGSRGGKVKHIHIFFVFATKNRTCLHLYKLSRFKNKKQKQKIYYLFFPYLSNGTETEHLHWGEPARTRELG